MDWKAYLSIAGLAASSDVGTASLLDGNGDCERIDCQLECPQRTRSIGKSHTDGDAQAVEANEVLAAVAAGDLLTVAALGGVVLARDLDLGVLVRSTLGGGEGNSGHGGDEERLEEGHFDCLVLFWWRGWKEASVVLLDWIDCLK
jgi:hypothetical protein